MPKRKRRGETRQPVSETRNLRLALAFDGTAYHGWQVQAKHATVQGVLSDAIRQITGEQVLPSGSGRTDAGTHARELVANFSTASKLSPERFVRALNGVLPRDIRVLSVKNAPADFDARRCARSKIYRYQIYRGPVMPPHLRCEYFHYPYTLDLKIMERAARMFEGKKDFAAFATGSGRSQSDDVRKSPRGTVRQIFHCELKRYGRRLLFTVEGTGFLRHMVRNMVGTLLEVGRGRMTLEQFYTLFEKRDRSLAGFTVPAAGLILLKVRY
jgi:tRNA pseudouridine38-40 synthase